VKSRPIPVGLASLGPPYVSHRETGHENPPFTTMTIYTRTGDCGETDLLGGVRLPKDAAPLEICGTLDELNALLGMARCESLPPEMASLLEQVQRQLFEVGGELVAGESARPRPNAVSQQAVDALEQTINRLDAQLQRATAFILPRGARAAATLHLARAVCRRAERRLVSLVRTKPPGTYAMPLSYLNRLGDLLFVLARSANAAAGVLDAPC
jgi:cob(I)alamin adenosyltransferase